MDRQDGPYFSKYGGCQSTMKTERVQKRKHVRHMEKTWEGSTDESNSETENKENVTRKAKIWNPHRSLVYNRIGPKCSYGERTDNNHVKKIENGFLKFSNHHSSVPKVLQSSVENLMQYAEILYKCKLCTTLPSILTSRDTFLSHVSHQHLNKSDQFKECVKCQLKFGTEEDLRAHYTTEHKAVAVDTDTEEEKCTVYNSDFSGPSSSDHEENMEKSNCKQIQEVDCNDTRLHPKLVITHGEVRTTPTLSTGENISKLQKLTDQILASNKKEIDGVKRCTPPPASVVKMTPNYTAEFGKYTKLVREGGNIVYFCQLCNWKSQVKLQFQGHCASTGHIGKVKATDQSDSESKCVEQKTPPSESWHTEYKEPVGWTPRGHMSFLTETSGYFVTKKMGDGRKSSESEISPPNRVIHGVDNSDTKISPPDNSDTRPGKQDKESDKSGLKLNKRKRTVPVVLRNESGCEDGWGSDELDESSNDSVDPGSPQVLSGGPQVLSGGPQVLSGSPQVLCLSNSKKRLLESRALSPEADPLQKSPNKMVCGEIVGGEQKEVASILSGKVREEVKEVAPSVSGKVREENLERTTAMIKNYFENQLGFRGLDQHVRKQSDSSDWVSIKGYSHHHGNLGPPSYSLQDHMYLYSCSLCDFGCHDIQDYKLHFENEHSQNHDVDPYESVSDGRGESWKMWKIKELLPDLIAVYPRGNVSRDLLLQKISLLLNIPEVVQWGPACNKAVREQFPHSMAQRKGKYKKFFFGVTLLEQLQEQEEVSDGEGVTYQPLRDMSQDMEKILSHLHSLVHWTGDLESGISRDEILELLKGRIEEPDVQHWGVQCNRAIRVLFPNVEMKRKGKYKTVFFGVDFRHDIHKQTFVPNKRGRPRKSPFFSRDSDEIFHRQLSWLDAMRTTDHLTDSFLDNPGDRTVTRGWGPGYSVLEKYSSQVLEDSRREDEDWPPQMSATPSPTPRLLSSVTSMALKSKILNTPSHGLNLSQRVTQSSERNHSLKLEPFHKSNSSEKSNTLSAKNTYNASRLFDINSLCQSSDRKSMLQPLPVIYSSHGDKHRSYKTWKDDEDDDKHLDDQDEDINDDGSDGDDEDSNGSVSSNRLATSHSDDLNSDDKCQENLTPNPDQNKWVSADSKTVEPTEKDNIQSSSL